MVRAVHCVLFVFIIPLYSCLFDGCLQYLNLGSDTLWPGLYSTCVFCSYFPPLLFAYNLHLHEKF